MREIKFRAWNAHENKMHTPFLWINESNLPAFVHVSTPTHELMQFTGLKDVNGVGIYEGDIVVITQDNEDSCCGSQITIGMAYIKHNGIEFVFDNKQYKPLGYKDWTNYATLGSIARNSSFEVIGNIHQNPELLEK